jgi:hypothetical protein
MKKSIGVILILITILIINSIASIVGADMEPRTKPPLNDKESEVGTAGWITFIFDDGTVALTDVPEAKTRTDDEMIEEALRGLRKGENIREITHVDGVPIAQTKWAKYGEVINHNVKADKVTVRVNHEPVYFFDTQPFIQEGRTLVPMRAVYEHFFVQADVEWNGIDRTVTATNREGITIVFTINQKGYKKIIDGIETTMENDIAPILHEGRTMLPLRALSQGLGLYAQWTKETKVVSITANEHYLQFLMAKKEWLNYLKGKGAK